jgi:hypothetical protein
MNCIYNKNERKISFFSFIKGICVILAITLIQWPNLIKFVPFDQIRFRKISSLIWYLICDIKVNSKSVLLPFIFQLKILINILLKRLYTVKKLFRIIYLQSYCKKKSFLDFYDFLVHKAQVENFKICYKGSRLNLTWWITLCT